MHKMVLSDPMPQVMDTSFILVSPVPRKFLMNEIHSIILYSITMHVSHPVNLVPEGENQYIWLRQVVNSVRMSEPVV